jgi:DNA-binding response OmpR family regulator
LAEPGGRRVVVVHPDAALRADIVAVLTDRGYHVCAGPRPGSPNGDRLGGDAAVVVIDHRSLPTTSGARVLAVLPELDEAAILTAFAAGADDVLAGPLRPAELASRVAVLMRRFAGPPRWRVGPIAIDPVARSVTLAGRPIELTRREYALLAELAASPGRVFTKQELLRELWTTPAGHPTRRLDTQVARLRRQLGEHRALLVTVWGVGYRLGG